VRAGKALVGCLQCSLSFHLTLYHCRDLRLHAIFAVSFRIANKIYLPSSLFFWIARFTSSLSSSYTQHHQLVYVRLLSGSESRLAPS